MNKTQNAQEFPREYLPELQELACWLLKQPETLLASFGEYADLGDEYVQEMLCRLSSLPAGEMPAQSIALPEQADSDGGVYVLVCIRSGMVETDNVQAYATQDKAIAAFCDWAGSADGFDPGFDDAFVIRVQGETAEVDMESNELASYLPDEGDEAER